MPRSPALFRAALAGLALTSCMPQATADEVSAGPLPGLVAPLGNVTPATVQIKQPAPDIAFLDGDRRRRSLGEFKGKFIILAFFAHW